VQLFKILIVDDFEDFRGLVGVTLRARADLHVIGEASDGLEAVQQAQMLQPDLVLLDIGMPRLNGIEAGRRIRKLCPSAKILFVSQESAVEVVQETFRLGAHGYLLKSEAGGELLPAIDAVLQGRQFICSKLKPYIDIPGKQMKAWRVSGTYFEACNCETISPWRKQDGQRLATRSTYGVCEFAISWRIVSGAFADVDLSDRFVVMAGSYQDDEPNKPWRVILYVDERCSDPQFAALTDIFLGRAGGTAFENFGARIAEIYAVRRAAIELDHTPRHWFMRASKWVEVRASRTVPSEQTVTCDIPGHDKPGNELVADAFQVQDAPFDFGLRERCGFETRFDYSSL